MKNVNSIRDIIIVKSIYIPKYYSIYITEEMIIM